MAARSAVPKRTGAVVVSYIGDDLLTAVQSEMPEMVVLCHSLSTDYAEAMSDMGRLCCPKTKFLLVLSELRADRPYKDAKFDAISLAESSRLIARVSELLGILPHHVMEGTASERQGPEAARFASDERGCLW